MPETADKDKSTVSRLEFAIVAAIVVVAILAFVHLLG